MKTQKRHQYDEEIHTDVHNQKTAVAVYAASVLAIEVDTPAEREYLHRLPRAEDSLRAMPDTSRTRLVFLLPFLLWTMVHCGPGDICLSLPTPAPQNFTSQDFPWVVRQLLGAQHMVLRRMDKLSAEVVHD
jgi:hypothetical protein